MIITDELKYLSDLPKNKDFGIGCIGSGFIMADCHLVAYRKAGLNPVAIASRSQENAQKVAERHEIKSIHEDYLQLLENKEVQILDVAVPPDIQGEVIRNAVQHADHIRAILAQKPLAPTYEEAVELVELCKSAGVTLAVNQNMRFDQSVRACKDVLEKKYLGDPILATIDMRAIPHWMPWQERLGWVTCRIMSIHHLDTMRYWFGNPQRIFASFREDPRTAQQFAHDDGICLYILEYENGLRCSIIDDVWAGPDGDQVESDIGIRWRIEGTDGLAKGTIGWPSYPERTPSTLDFTTKLDTGARWHQPRWDEVWFPDAFIGPMAELISALEDEKQLTISGEDNLNTMALVEAAYLSAKEHRAISLTEITS